MTEQTTDLRGEVRQRYAAAATAVRTGAQPSCCDVDTSGAVDTVEVGDGFGGQLYDAIDRDALPAQAAPPAWGAATRWRWQNYRRARPC